MWGYAPDVPVSELDNAQNTQSAALLAVGEGYFSLYPAQMWSGRALAYDELRYGDRVALLDEQIALQLFGTTDAVDRRVNILGREYRVAGVARHRSAVGDPAACFAYVPLRAVARDGAQLSTLVLAAPPGAGAGGLQAVTDMTNLLLPGGTVHDSRRARQLALLVPRWALGALAAYLLGLAMVWLFALGGRWRARVADELRERYLVRMLPVLLLRALAWLAAFGALCALAWLLAGQLIQPVLAFPEWVPLVPVEPEEIQRTFWNLQWKNNLMIRCETPLSLRLRFFGSLANTASSVGLIALVIALINRLRSR